MEGVSGQAPDGKGEVSYHGGDHQEEEERVSEDLREVLDTALLYVNPETGQTLILINHLLLNLLLLEYHNRICLDYKLQMILNLFIFPPPENSEIFSGQVKEVVLFDCDTKVGLGHSESGSRNGFKVTNSSRRIVIRCDKENIK